MKTFVAALLSLALLLIPALAVPAGAAGPDSDSSPGDDLGVQLTDMFAAMASALANLQDQKANEAYLGSAASTHRLSKAVLHVPAVSVRGARPFVEGLILGDD